MVNFGYDAASQSGKIARQAESAEVEFCKAD